MRFAGATWQNSQGADCWVPPTPHNAAAQASWCNCMYSDNAMLLARCNWKFWEELKSVPDDPMNKKVLWDPTMPWTVTGSRSRGLVDDMLAQALQWAGGAANDASKTVSTSVLDSVSTTPATTGNTPVTGGTTPNTKTTAGAANMVQWDNSTITSRVAQAARLTSQLSTTRTGGGSSLPQEQSWYPPAMTESKTPMILGAVALAGAAFYFLSKKKSGGGALSGYSPRRRKARKTSRRSRR